MTIPENLLNISDEDLLKMDPSQLAQAAGNTAAETSTNEAENQQEQVEQQEADQQNNADETGGENSTDESTSGEDNEQAADEQEQGDGSEGKRQEPAQDPHAAGQEVPADKAKSVESQDKTKSEPKPKAGDKPADGEGEGKDERDYKAELGRVLSPIKANGREIQVSSVDDAIQLMQMGANYHKKMAALKPNLAVLKLLEQHGLLDQEKLSYLIDLDKKNPDAIKKLVKDSGIDPLDIDTDKAGNYKPSNYSVDDKAVELDAVLDELKGSQHYAPLLQTVGKDWDAQSRQIIADTPDLLRTLHSHMSSGIFAKIISAVETERAFGRLSGMSDLEAYRAVGDKLNAQGAFNSVSASTATAPAKVVPVKAASTPNTNSAAKQKKLAASTSRASAPVQQAPFNPLSMSDDELMKLDITKFTTR